MKRRPQILIAMLSLMVLCACAATGNNPPADPRVTDQYLSAAAELEERGDLTAALEQYKLALTVDPANGAANENSLRLSQKLNKMADEHYQIGKKYNAEGKYGLARKEFLMALNLVPDHPEASQMLVNRESQKSPSYVFHVVKTGESLSTIAKQYYGDYKKYESIATFNNITDATMVKPGQRIMIPQIDGADVVAGTFSKHDDKTTYIEHALRPGESISRLAQLFYGDYRQFHIIAQFNGMDDATRVTAGQIIKVPKVAGFPFYADAVRAGSQQKPPATVTGENTPSVPSSELSREEQILAYRQTGMSLLKEGNYEEAIFDLIKAVEASPKDLEIRKMLSLAYFESGKRKFQRQDFTSAREAFEKSKQYNPKCDQCQSYIEQSKIGPALLYRSKGLENFNKAEFKQAIIEFEEYLKVKPQDNEVRDYYSKSYYQQALEDYHKGDFLEAKKGFASALEYDSACEKCKQFIGRSLERFKEKHYNRGIFYFGKEQLPEAIAEWETIQKIDPNYKDVAQNLKRARLLLEKLEKIKQGSNSDS